MKYLKYIAIIVSVLVIIAVMVLVYNDKITQNSPLHYKNGIEFYNNGDYRNAYYNFGKIKWISPLYSMALYRQAKSAQNIGDYGTAILKYESFLEKNHNSVFTKNAKNNLAKCYFYLKKYDEAKAQFEDLHKSSDFISDKNYYMALIERKDNKKKAAEYFITYLNNALYGSETRKDYILSAAEELSEIGFNYNNQDIKTIGIAYYKSKKYKEALKYFSKLPVDMCWDYLVLSNNYAGNKLIAKKLIESSLITYSKKIEEDNLHEIYNIYTSYMHSTKLNNWLKMYNIVKSNSLGGEDYVMYKVAGLLSGDKAVSIYKDIVKNYPNGNYAPESMWKVFWDSYIKKNYTTAQELAIQHLKSFQNVKSTPRIMFWLGKLFIKENKNSEAHNILTKLISKYPDDYYGIRAEYILNKKTDFFKTNNKDKITDEGKEIEFPIYLSEIEIKDLKLINTLFEMGDYEIWADADFKNPILDSWIEYKKGKKSKSILLARNYINNMDIKPPFSNAEYKLAFPKYYIDEINIAGQKLNIDPYLILAIIREESYFNEGATSSVNAKGLMQIMPETAKYMVDKLTQSQENNLNLEDIRLNLYVGCNYLRYLEDRFNNDLYVIAAYNGGEGSVNKWSKQFANYDDDEFVELIPYEETKHYVKKVFRAYHIYKKIYK